jgi:hypothetical protein
MGKLEAFFASVLFKVILAVALWLLIWFAWHEWQSAANSRSETRLSESHGQAVQDSARDAIGSVGALNGRDTASDDLTRRNADAIRSAPGAAAPVDPALRDAGLIGLCKRRAYSRSADCLQFTPAASVAGSGAGSAAAKR